MMKHFNNLNHDEADKVQQRSGEGVSVDEKKEGTLNDFEKNSVFRLRT
jgi:hypothetical protein